MHGGLAAGIRLICEFHKALTETQATGSFFFNALRLQISLTLNTYNILKSLHTKLHVTTQDQL